MKRRPSVQALERVFSRRLPGDLRPNAFSICRAAARVRIDLTASNPTDCGIAHPENVLAPLTHPAGRHHRPDPRGLATARHAVAAQYRRQGIDLDAERILLTSSTSEAYSYLFKLLCDPGDEVLVPAPSYPLFEHLASLEGVRTRAYRLDPEEGWQPDPAIASRIEPARAVLAVHPTNPTGSYLAPASARDLARACRRAGAALIVDEVFHSYSLGGDTPSPSLAGSAEALTFTLGGLSKSAALPQLKLAWTVVSGPEPAVREAVDRLAFLSDQYLTVGTPVQAALPDLLAIGAVRHERVLDRCRANLAFLEAQVAEARGIALVTPAGGWSAVVRFPNVLDEEELVLQLLEEDGVVVHPGFFYDFEREGFLVVSLLPPTDAFAQGVRLVIQRIVAGCSPAS